MGAGTPNQVGLESGARCNFRISSKSLLHFLIELHQNGHNLRSRDVPIGLQLILEQPHFVEDVPRIANVIPDLVQAFLRLGVQAPDLQALGRYPVC